MNQLLQIFLPPLRNSQVGKTTINGVHTRSTAFKKNINFLLDSIVTSEDSKQSAFTAPKTTFDNILPKKSGDVSIQDSTSLLRLRTKSSTENFSVLTSPQGENAGENDKKSPILTS